MNIKVTHFKDNPDGSATVIVDTDAEANEFLLKYGLVCALQDAIEKSKAEYTPDEETMSEISIQNSDKEEFEAMKEIMAEQDKKIRAQTNQIVEYHNMIEDQNTTIKMMAQVIDSYLMKSKTRGVRDDI